MLDKVASIISIIIIVAFALSFFFIIFFALIIATSEWVVDNKKTFENLLEFSLTSFRYTFIAFIIALIIASVYYIIENGWEKALT